MLKINDNVKFHYLKQFKDELKAGQVLTDYTDQSELYSGKIVDVRNIIDQPVSQDTIRRANIKGRRSEMLYTVELVDGDVKAFYDGRMVGTQGYLRGDYKGSVAVKRSGLDFRLARPQYILVGDILLIGWWPNTEAS